MAAWQPDVDSVRPDGVSARATAGAESPWFSGHFPADPVLPGVAMLSLVDETVRRFVQGAGAPPRDIVGFRRVRFRHPVRPGDTLRVTVRRGKSNDVFDFEVHVGDKMACSGTCLV
jgi:3-hydroxyacyl-[acyl-carrier-protein] dehydratase